MKLFIGVIVVLSLGIIGYFIFQTIQRNDFITNKNNSLTGNSKNATNLKEINGLFVPYWTIAASSDVSGDFNTVIYFGITPNDSGINRTDDGYKNLTAFKNKFNSQKETWVTLRMINSTQNFQILENTSLQKKIIDETIVIAKEEEFDGILLNLELSSLPFGKTVDQINTFTEQLYKKAKAENLTFAITMYGDTYSRYRPFDVPYLANHSDYVLIMAYDFHKAKENPGPNFPLQGEGENDYDFEAMILDFINVVPKEQLVIIFGMYGYDWELDENGENNSLATSLSLNQIQDRFLSSCSFLNCRVNRDVKSAETVVTYTDSEGNKHEVWFEDEESMGKKREFLNKNGIHSYALWAYSYY